jgi:hypothetical protein
MTATGNTKGVPLQPLFVGVIEKLTVVLGHTTLLDSGAEILPPLGKPVPDCPSEEVQLNVVPGKLEFKLVMLEVPGEQMLGELLLAVAVGAGVTLTVNEAVSAH